MHSDTSYLSESNAWSRADEHFFMSNNSADPPNNDAVLAISQIIKAVVSSADEADLGALFIHYRDAIPAWHTVIEMGHPQPQRPSKRTTRRHWASSIYYCPAANESHGHAFPLAARSHPAASILALLDAWPT